GGTVLRSPGRPARPTRHADQGEADGYYSDRHDQLGGLAHRRGRQGLAGLLRDRDLRRVLGGADRGSQRPDEPGGADRRGARVLLLDGSVRRAEQGGHSTAVARDDRRGDVRGRPGDHRHPVERGRPGGGPQRGRLHRGCGGCQAELPCLPGAGRRPRHHRGRVTGGRL
ncbi:MAG: Peroxiredoxin OsmC, partial [uncultured Nocardioidaceae bacterium]